ncbi:hypothetical protein [Actinoplanes utahensis]|uniref:hypothetical protein n=1 Tax=Actinoplanes utahensis TaxID=1869 RepID=UPI000A5BF80E|nr:hypothetical protein [Actinoplanes utahensis]
MVLREDTLVGPLDAWLAQAFGPLHRDHTVATILEQAAIGLPVSAPMSDLGGPSLAELDAKLARYRATLDAGGDPVVVAGWIAEVETERRAVQSLERARAQKSDTDRTYRMTSDELNAMIDEVGGVVTALREANPDDKLDVYRDSGLRLTFQPESRTVRADVDLAQHRWHSVCVRGPTLATRTL